MFLVDYISWHLKISWPTPFEIEVLGEFGCKVNE